MRKVLTTKQVAHRLHYSKNHIVRHVKLGHIPAFRLAPNSPWRYYEDEIEELIRQQHNVERR